ncbi:Uma2 family endonuclease [Methylomonas sp. SURF-2]|uniref:Uma2 family endonuclease n=1 Tax=Methylomonas subterranea TaxID=2952225 RepID=A0ABT1TGG2_9GAMM|nr:Uma2 family endonuclease [Methylomonas sp. SURF-2]MCQ8103849.1 Uma2 family endonuclease [Methylomonas sp. SURF-2]
MSLKRAENFIGETEYLSGEMLAETKHEYIDGEVFAMAGASRNHQRLVGNLHAALNRYLANHPCEPFANDLKVKAESCFFYPDLVVVCDDANGDEYYIDKPTLIVEVLSKTTRRMDKTTKLAAYKTLPSLLEYVLIEQDHVEVELFRRSQNWFAEHYFLGDSFNLESIDLTVNVTDLYHRVDNEDMRDYLQQLAQQAG